jgi:FdrA protein
VLGLYTGGTLAGEAKVLLGRAGVAAEVLDLGDDQYTAGRPHPMIDPAARAARITAAAEDPTVGVVLLDVVLGHGAHPDPAGAVAAAVRAATRPLAFVASICGTAADPQGLDAQARTLREAGVLLAGSNAAATRLAIQLAEGGRP